jgi:hypothetical protein
MNNTTIAQVLTLPDGTAIDSLQGSVTEVYKARTVSGGKSAQDIKLRDGTGAEVKCTVWEHPELSIYKGKDVIIQSNKNGLKVKFDNYRPPGTNTVSVSKTCTFQFLQVHHAQTGGSTPVGNPPASEGASGRGAASPSNPTGPATIVVNGAKVGMAINNSCQFLVAAGEKFSPDRVHEIASELIRLSNKMEQGELAEPKSNPL